MRVVCVEGLFGILLGSKMTNSLKSRGVPVVTTSWFKNFEFKDGDIVCLHSFGLGKLKAALGVADTIFVLDGRMPPWGGPTKIDVSKYNVFNYYQTGFMRGHRITGAKVNQAILGISHMEIPNNAAFIFDFFTAYRSRDNA